MLDTIFKNGERKQAHDELRALLMQARSERTALRSMLDQAGGVAEKLARTDKALEELGTKAAGMAKQVERLAGATAAYDERARGFDKVEARVSELLIEVSEARRAAQALTASDGDLRQHRQAMDELGAQARGAQATLAALRQEGEKLGELRGLLQRTTAEVAESVAGLATLKNEMTSLRSLEGELRQEMQGLREVAREAKGDSAAAAATVKEVDSRIASLAQLQDLAKDTDKRLASLNALAEHVSHKTRALETQRHTVEHAVVEATRLNEMVWNMDAQIAKLSDGRDQLQRTEETVARIEQMTKTATQELAAATSARDAFLRESEQLSGQGRSLSESLRATIERLSVDKKELEAFDQRLKSISLAVGETEARVQTVLAKDETLAAMQQKAEGLGKVFAALSSEAEALARRQDSLASLSEQLQQVDALGKRTAVQHQSLMQSQHDLEAVRGDLAGFHSAYAEAVQLRDKLALDRAALESFAERTATMLARTPELEARLDAVLGKMNLVEVGDKAAARLAEVAAGLDEQLTRVGARQQFVERLEERVNGLYGLTSEVDRKLGEQLARRSEVDNLKSLCDALGAQIIDAQGKLDGVATQQERLLPITTQVAALQQMLEHSQRLAGTVKRDESSVQEQQARLADLALQGKQLALEATERLKQVQAANDELGRAATLKEQMLAELARVQAGQRDAVAQIDLADDQLKRAEAMVRQLEQRRTQLLQTEKVIAAFEGRLGELDRGAEAVEQKIKALADREALVHAVKAEVDGIREISGRSRADLQFVTDHRSEVTDLRSRVEDLMGRVEDTDGKIALIETRRKMVEEVQSRASTITSMLGDINLNLEMLGEQRAVIDHVGEKLARLDYTVQEAQNTLRALQREREVAERIEQGIKALRTRGGTAAAPA